MWVVGGLRVCIFAVLFFKTNKKKKENYESVSYMFFFYLLKGHSIYL